MADRGGLVAQKSLQLHHNSGELRRGEHIAVLRHHLSGIRQAAVAYTQLEDVFQRALGACQQLL